MKHPIKQALLIIYDTCWVVERMLEQIVLGSWDSLKLKTVISHLSHLVGQSKPGKCRLLNTYENKYRHRTQTRWIKLFTNEIFISGKYK